MIRYVNGDATKPEGIGNKIIIHVCNDIGAWGAGFVLALSRRWHQPEKDFLRWSHNGFDGQKPVLGDVRLVQVEPDIWVANMIGQHKIKTHEGVPPVRYDAIRGGLAKINQMAKEKNATIHMPRIGCGLAGGTWDRIEAIIQETMPDLEVVVYDLPQTP